MSDIKQVFNSIVKKYKDLGDGSYAEVIALDGGVTLSGPITVSSEIEVTNDNGNPLPVTPVIRQCVGQQTLSVTTAAVSSLTVPATAVAALVQVDGPSSCSITQDNTTPTASVGLRLDDGVFFYVDTDLTKVKLLARTATTTVQVKYFNRA
jgi:hypothetical protein